MGIGKLNVPSGVVGPLAWVGYGQLSISGALRGAGVWALLGGKADVNAATAQGLPSAAAIVAKSFVNADAINGESEAGNGVSGVSNLGTGIYGVSSSTTGAAGVLGEAVGPGVVGKSQTWHGVYGETSSSRGGVGVWGKHLGNGAGIVGESQSGIGIIGKGPQLAGRFEGNVHVTGGLDCGGDITCANGADCAEYFDVAQPASVGPGTVMVLGEGGALLESWKEYDKRVAGVVSGAGGLSPGILLDKRPLGEERKALALVGKVFCKVDASYGSIEVGDLLTTSPTQGHAMKAIDPQRGFGAVLGKALQPLAEGQGLLPILVALQ